MTWARTARWTRTPRRRSGRRHREDVIRLPQWDGSPVWPHGDLLPGNLLTEAVRLTAAIDFGGLGAGDPAADTPAAWAVFTADTRDLFREARVG
ncbi:phosphotransferase [Streptomyces yaanensis]|uniref:Phosphotransferase n=1 Tax=Streptomyces yaanensis TaxID=1142239 RepID=A0ABV7SID9_9ACTN|nr:phosphotransferase [Streptomyces sp. CGMCC 4.7035]WNC01702.1 phosphotransferase [Streptomyces sp. CGMCC 4.7035]